MRSNSLNRGKEAAAKGLPPSKMKGPSFGKGYKEVNDRDEQGERGQSYYKKNDENNFKDSLETYNFDKNLAVFAFLKKIKF